MQARDDCSAGPRTLPGSNGQAPCLRTPASEDRLPGTPRLPPPRSLPPWTPLFRAPPCLSNPQRGETPLPRHDWAHGVRGWRSRRGNISEPRAPVRLRCAFFLWSDSGKARVRRGLTARGFSLSRPLLKTAAKKKQQGTIPARKRSPLKNLSRGFESFFVGWKILLYVVSAGPS